MGVPCASSQPFHADTEIRENGQWLSRGAGRQTGDCHLKVLQIALAALLLVLFLPNPVLAQDISQTALAAFPADTQQIAYVDLGALRQLPNFHQISGALLNRQMLSFEEFLHSMESDPSKQVNEAAVGLRAEGPQTLFGLASGEFDPEQVQNFIARQKFPTEQYDGFTLDSFGGGLSPNGLFFTFINPGLAAFGRLPDLQALLDGYLGQRVTLSSNKDFVNWVNQLDGSAPEWGITTGKAATTLAAPWLLSGSKQKVDLSSVLGPMKAVLYTANWDSGFTAQITAICQNSQSAGTLARLLSIWRDSASLRGPQPAGVAEFVQSLQVSASGDEVQILASGSPQVFLQLLHNVSGK